MDCLRFSEAALQAKGPQASQAEKMEHLQQQVDPAEQSCWKMLSGHVYLMHQAGAVQIQVFHILSRLQVLSRILQTRNYMEDLKLHSHNLVQELEHVGGQQSPACTVQ